MALEAITDHAARALSRVRLQFRNSSDVIGVVGALALEVQALEDSLITMNSIFRDPLTATGAALDEIAKIVDAPERGPRTDAEFRTVIAASILRNNSFGRLEDLLSIANVFLVEPNYWSATIATDANDPVVSASGAVGGDEVILIESESGAGSYGSGIGGPLTLAKALEVEGFLKALAPAGVRVILLVQLAATPFAFDGAGAALDVGTFYTAIDRV